MIQWMLLPGAPDAVTDKAAEQAWVGGAAVITQLPLGRNAAPVTIVAADGARARRKARYPEILTDWAEIYGAKLFPDDTLPVICEEASGLGKDALAIFGEPGLTRATVAWYAKGALAVYERVANDGTVAWAPGQQLGRPFDGSLRQVASWVGRKVTSDKDAPLFDRMDNTTRATGEALIARALWRLLDTTPPTLDKIAGMVTSAPERRLPR